MGLASQSRVVLDLSSRGALLPTCPTDCDSGSKETPRPSLQHLPWSCPAPQLLILCVSKYKTSQPELPPFSEATGPTSVRLFLVALESRIELVCRGAGCKSCAGVGDRGRDRMDSASRAGQGQFAELGARREGTRGVCAYSRGSGVQCSRRRSPCCSHEHKPPHASSLPLRSWGHWEMGTRGPGA